MKFQQIKKGEKMKTENMEHIELLVLENQKLKAEIEKLQQQINGEINYHDNSLVMKANDDGYVDMNYNGINSEGYKFCKVRIILLVILYLKLILSLELIKIRQYFL